MFDDSALVKVGREYEHPREPTSRSPQRIRHMCSALNHRGFQPLNGTIPEEMEEGVDMERAYDVIKGGPSHGVHYDIPKLAKSNAFSWSSDSQFGVVNPCYSTAAVCEGKETKFYDVSKDSK